MVLRKHDHGPGPVSASSRLDAPEHRRAHEFWWSVRRAIGRSLASRFFSRTSAVLMSAHDGGVNHHVFVVRIACQRLENSLENAALGPSAKALVHDLPVAETHRQISPRNSRSKSGNDRGTEEPV